MRPPGIDRTPPPHGFVNWRPDVCELCREFDPARDLWLAGYSWDELSLRVPLRSREEFNAHRANHSPGRPE